MRSRATISSNAEGVGGTQRGGPERPEQSRIRVEEGRHDTCTKAVRRMRQRCHSSRCRCQFEPGPHWPCKGTFVKLIDVLVPTYVQMMQALATRSEANTSELQSLMRISYAVFCLKKKKRLNYNHQIDSTIPS